MRPTVIQHGDACYRADDLFAPGSIIEDIVASISSADYLIADITERNSNVYYELGFAHALKKPVILISLDLSNVPFDLKHQRIIGYEDTVAGATSLREALTKYLPNV